MAVIRVTATGPTQFISIIKLGNSAECQNQGKREFDLLPRAAFGTGKARNVMDGKEGHEEIGPRVERILAKNVCNAAGGSTTEENVANCKEKREIDNRGEARINSVPAFLPADEKR